MKWGKWIAYSIASLAAIGLVGQLILNPTSFLRNMLMMIGVAVVIGFLLYFFLIRKRRNVDSGYKKAVKQSQRMYGKPNSKPKTNTNAKTNAQPKSQRMPRLKKKTGDQPQLRVIEGNKK